jgi:TetR/AcrR family transcriptional regulator, regulator of autoinduction and epiphytic fitness
METEDGRSVRRARNRDAVVDAMLALHREGRLNPSSDEIAQRAGLSPRSLFRYFTDIDDLCRAAIARQQERITPLTAIDVAPEAPLVERIDALVRVRCRLFEETTGTATVARLRAPSQPLIADQLQQARTYFRQQVRRLFAAELAALGPAAPAALAAADVLASFESYQLLRRDQGLTIDDTAAALGRALTAVLAPAET